MTDSSIDIVKGFSLMVDAQFLIQRGVDAADPQTEDAGLRIARFNDLQKILRKAETEYQPDCNEVEASLPEGWDDT